VFRAASDGGDAAGAGQPSDDEDRQLGVGCGPASANDPAFRRRAEHVLRTTCGDVVPRVVSGDDVADRVRHVIRQCADEWDAGRADE
jgi:hypothetical protein